MSGASRSASVSISHYCEKTRWHLDLGDSITGSKIFCRASTSSSAGSRPPTVRCSSTAAKRSAIRRRSLHLEEQYPQAPLLPREPSELARVLETEAYFDDTLGPAVRGWVYGSALATPGMVRRLFFGGYGSAVRATGMVLMGGVLEREIRRMYRLDDAKVAEASRQIDEAAARIEQLIDGDPSRYLVGGGLTLADITAASLLAPSSVRPNLRGRASKCRRRFCRSSSGAARASGGAMGSGALRGRSSVQGESLRAEPLTDRLTMRPVVLFLAQLFLTLQSTTGSVSLGTSIGLDWERIQLLVGAFISLGNGGTDRGAVVFDAAQVPSSRDRKCAPWSRGEPFFEWTGFRPGGGAAVLPSCWFTAGRGAARSSAPRDAARGAGFSVVAFDAPGHGSSPDCARTSATSRVRSQPLGAGWVNRESSSGTPSVPSRACSRFVAEWRRRASCSSRLRRQSSTSPYFATRSTCPKPSWWGCAAAWNAPSGRPSTKWRARISREICRYPGPSSTTCVIARHPGESANRSPEPGPERHCTRPRG